MMDGFDNSTALRSLIEIFQYASGTCSPFWHRVKVFCVMFGLSSGVFLYIIHSVYEIRLPVERAGFPFFFYLKESVINVIIIYYIYVTSNDMSSRMTVDE